jgi:streptogramin lyase
MREYPISSRSIAIVGFLLLWLVGSVPAAAQPQMVTHLAGPTTGGPGYVDGPGAKAQFGYPWAVAVDSTGIAAVVEWRDGTIRRVGLDGAVSTIAGAYRDITTPFADGNGAAARFWYARGAAFDGNGNLYIVDTGNRRVRKVTPSGDVTTLAGNGVSAMLDGSGSAARFKNPAGIGYSAADGNLYVSDEHAIRRVTLAGVVTTIAGASGASGSTDGACASARFAAPTGIAADSAGNLYVANTSGHTIRKIAMPACSVSTLAGLPGTSGSADGTATAARFSYPRGVAMDGDGSVLVADSSNAAIRRVTQGGEVTTVAGVLRSPGSSDGTGAAARFGSPYGIAATPDGFVIVDAVGSTLRTMTTAAVVTTLAGTAAQAGGIDGSGRAARFDHPYGMAIDAADNVYVADWSGQVVRKVTSAGIVTTIAGAYGMAGTVDGPAADARFTSPNGVAVDASGNVYVSESARHTVRKIAANGAVTTLAGLSGTSGTANGTGSEARFNQPYGLAVDSDGNVYVADRGNNAIRRVTSAGVVTTYAGLPGSTDLAVDGTAGPGGTARFSAPESVALDAGGNLFVADYGSGTARKITPGGQVTTVAGQLNTYGSTDGPLGAGTMNSPQGIAVAPDGTLYVSDAYNELIRKVSPSGTMTTLAGNCREGHVDGYPRRSQTGSPTGIVVDSKGRVIFSDLEADAIRMVWRPASVRNDFDLDAKSDVGVYRPASGTWFSLDSSANNSTFRFEGWGVQAQNDTPVVGDFDGDGTIDPTVFRPASGTWFTLESHASFTTWSYFGWGEAADTLVPGDYDGDGKTDAAVYRASSGTWYVRPSSGAAQWNVAFGEAGDVPVVGDFDGDGKRDPAVYRSSTGTWFWLESSTNLATYQSKGWGVEAQGDVPAPGDYDGDGKTDPCVFRPSTGAWFILESHAGYTTWTWFGWGGTGDQLVPADYDGDGRTDGAIYRPSTGVWYIKPSGGGAQWSVTFGQSGDVPLVTTK